MWSSIQREIDLRMSLFILIELSFWLLAEWKPQVNSSWWNRCKGKTNGKISNNQWWDSEKKQGNLGCKINTHKGGQERWRKAGQRKKQHKQRRREVQVTAMEAFDLWCLINGDYGPCACVSLDYGSNTSRQWCIQRSSTQTAPHSREVLCTTPPGCIWSDVWTAWQD